MGGGGVPAGVGEGAFWTVARVVVELAWAWALRLWRLWGRFLGTGRLVEVLATAVVAVEVDDGMLLDVEPPPQPARAAARAIPAPIKRAWTDIGGKTVPKGPAGVRSSASEA